MEQNNLTWYVFKKGKKIIKTQKKPKIDLDKIGVFPTEESADSYVSWLENLYKDVK